MKIWRYLLSDISTHSDLWQQKTWKTKNFKSLFFGEKEIEIICYSITHFQHSENGTIKFQKCNYTNNIKLCFEKIYVGKYNLPVLFTFLYFLLLIQFAQSNFCDTSDFIEQNWEEVKKCPIKAL